MRQVAIILGSVLGLLGCRAHGPFGEASALADNGRCEDAIGSLVPAKLPPALSLRVVGGIAIGMRSCATRAECRAEIDLSAVSQAMRNVAECYEDRDDEPNLVTAFVQLQQIVEGPVYDGSTEGERQRVDAQIERVEAKLKAAKPDYGRDILAKDGQLAQTLPAH